MLQRALQGKTDTQLARVLDLALPTIKSRWRAIYDRAGQLAPEILPDTGVPSPDTAGSRKQEKRRQLLEYLRRHPEELRLGLHR
jgi:hypothetical protein